ncbi:hypothetical protein [Leptospira kmetyi]|uniref:hypothetical protein n=1 Tax=Leptospira kmetyi TaxID=408139 RepID=UPI00108310A5|nr:hypothetical protein [Leptospira kmetyi]TGK21576.1 hypothetical protein EHO62_03960 [Leptospira kmetyi]TGK28503.1 hypothetical protein EHO66_13440 [Leptospira kmetyi]
MKANLTKIKNYWSSKNVFFVSLIVIVLVSTLSAYIGNKPLAKHLKEICLTLGLVFFLFLYYGLFHGYRWFEESIQVEYKTIDLDLSGINISNIDIPDFDIGPLGFILTLLSWLFFSVFIIVACIYFISFLWIAFVFTISILNWIFYRGLRIIFINAKRCRGNHFQSLLISAKFTIGYLGWVVLLVFTYDFLKY